jgi:TonB family protein
MLSAGLGGILEDKTVMKPPRLAAAVAASVILHVALLGMPTGHVQGDSNAEGARHYQALITPLTASAGPANEVRSSNAPALESASTPSKEKDSQHVSSSVAELNAATQRQAGNRQEEYFPKLQLEKAPTPIDEVQLEYPPEALGQSGTVVLRLFINERGTLDELEVVSAVPPGIFDAAARRDFSRIRFVPGTRLGVAVKSQLQIEVAYTPLNRGGSVEAPR